MKKSLMFIMLGIISFLGINSVKAETFTSSDFFIDFDTYINDYNTYKENIDYLVNYWEDNFSQDYPYYGIIDFFIGTYVGQDKPVFILYYTNDNKVYFSGDDIRINDYGAISYDVNNNSYSYSGTLIAPYIFGAGSIKSFKLLLSNGLIFDGSSYYDKISFPSYFSTESSFMIENFEISDGDVFPSIMSLYNGSYNPNITSNYTEIDLNNYSSVILTLKDYTSRDTFTSTMYVKGQLCPTTLYNYGMEEKKDYISGYQTQPCSYYYNDFTPFISYIKSEDIKNHAVYYLTAYDKSKPNLVKVDNSIYDITYITEENKDNPYVNIDGKNYPVLSYDSLTDSSTLTEKNGVSNEWTCAKYDTDCLTNSSGMNVSDLFDKPLEFLKGLWSSITSIFEVITEFISLLPETMQSFLYLSFMVAIVLGLLKLIL